MSDALSARLHQGGPPKKPKTHEDRLVEAMDKALANTTIHRAGTPWDEVEGKDDGGRERGYIIGEAD
jgi:hypothetical protein